MSYTTMHSKVVRSAAQWEKYAADLERQLQCAQDEAIANRHSAEEALVEVGEWQQHSKDLKGLRADLEKQLEAARAETWEVQRQLEKEREEQERSLDEARVVQDSALAQSQRAIADLERKVELAKVEIQDQKARCREREEELLEANGVITRMEFEAREHKMENDDLKESLSQSMDECRRLTRVLEEKEEEEGS